MPKITPQKLNEWRIVPRVLVILSGYMCYDIAHWFMALPDPTSAQSAFVSVVWGASAGWFGLYVNSGNNTTEV